MKTLPLLLLLLPTAAWSWSDTSPGKPVQVFLGVTAVLPEHWLYRGFLSPVFASRDGPLLNSIDFELHAYTGAFPASKREFRPDMPLEDLADNYVAELGARSYASAEIRVVDIEPVVMAGQPAFRVHLLYRARLQSGGALIEQMTVGTPLDSGLLLVTYNAPKLHYFEAHRADFEQVVAQVKTTHGKPQSGHAP